MRPSGFEPELGLSVQILLLIVRRLSNDERLKITQFSAQGMSLRTIVRQLGLPKGTVYYHFRKTLGRKIKPLTLNFEPSQRLGEFLGIFASDGSYSFARKSYHYGLELDLSGYQMEYALEVSEMIQEIFGKKPRIWANKKHHMIQVRLYGKSISKVLMEFLSW